MTTYRTCEYELCDVHRHWGACVLCPIAVAAGLCPKKNIGLTARSANEGHPITVVRRRADVGTAVAAR